MQMVIIWLAILIIAIIVEVMTLGLTTIWFAGGALIAAVVAMINAPLSLQIVLFLVVSILHRLHILPDQQV